MYNALLDSIETEIIKSKHLMAYGLFPLNFRLPCEEEEEKKKTTDHKRTDLSTEIQALKCDNVENSISWYAPKVTSSK